MGSEVKVKFKQTEIGSIPEDWQVLPLEQVSEIIDCLHSKKPPKKNRGCVYLEVFNLIPEMACINVSNLTYISTEDYDYWIKRAIPKWEDLIITKTGIKAVAMIPKNFECCIGRNMALVKPNKKKIIPEFLRFYSLSHMFKKEIQRLSLSGTILESMHVKYICKIRVAIPSLAEQQRIVEVLNPFFKKDTINKNMGSNLEDIGQSLFHRWFIDFEFPNEDGKPYKSSGGKMVDSELGEIPKGWEITDISKVTNIVDCLHSKKPERVKEGKILLQVFNIEKNGELNLSDFYFVSDGDYDSWTRKIEVKKGDLIISKTGRVGAIAQIPEDLKFGIGRNLVAIRPTKMTPTFALEYLLSKYGKREIQRMTMSGTILRSLHVKYIKKFQILVPHPHVINLYEKIARPFRVQIENNLKENIILTRLRETLIPKLMTGKIRVPIVNDKMEAS